MKRFMDPSSLALQALQPANVQSEAAAARIAGAGEDSADGANPDVVDLSAVMVALMSAQHVFEANIATLKTADQMQKTLVDLRT